MKRTSLLSLTLLLFVFCFSVFASPSYGQDQDFGAMYRNYFKTIIDGNFAGAWDGLASESKYTIAKLISREAKKVQISPERVLQMLDNNENDMRDTYFSEFRKNIGELLSEIYTKGIFTVKSVSDQNVVVTIEVQKEPKDFRMYKQDGKWKVNFFQDLLEGK